MPDADQQRLLDQVKPCARDRFVPSAILCYYFLSGDEMKQVRLEIVTRVLTTFDHCSHCEIIFDQADINRKFHQRDLNEYPPDLAEEFVRLSDWIKELSRLYRHRLLIRLIDIQSPLGIYKSLRHRIRTYPAFIINGREKYAGWDREHLERLLDQTLRSDLADASKKVQPSPT